MISNLSYKLFSSNWIIFIPIVKGLVCSVIVTQNFEYSEDPPGLSCKNRIKNKVKPYIVKDHNGYGHQKNGGYNNAEGNRKSHAKR